MDPLANPETQSPSPETPPGTPVEPLQVFSPAPQSQPIVNGPTIPDPAPSYMGATNPSTNPSDLIFTPPQPVKKSRLSFLRPSKKIFLPLVIVMIVGGGSAAAYFGYYVPTQPANVWSKALINTGKGYDKLSEYATTPKHTKGLALKGSFKVSGSVAADGNFGGASQNNNSQLSGTVSAAGLKVTLDVRSISSNGNSPDIYFKVGGLGGLGNLLGGGDPTYTNALNGLNDKWYVVDHTLFDQFAQGSNANLQLTNEDVSSALKAIGDASKQYVFTADQQKMVFKTTKNIGKEKIDGRSTYHYKVSIDKTNLKAYLKALCSNLKSSKLNKFFDGSGQSIDQTLGCQNSDNATNQISSSDSADVWVDLHTKLIHKVRFSGKTNPSDYFDIAQDYQGGDNFPFSLAFSSEQGKDTTTGSVKMALNMKTNSFDLKGDLKTSGSSSESGTFSLTITPSNTPVKAEAPAGARNIIDLLNDLGIGELFSGSGDSSTSGISTSAKARDTERKTDINALQSQMEVYYVDAGFYPTLANVNDPAWRSVNMKGMDNAALQDPDGTAQKLVALPAANSYSYQALPAGCDNIHTQCTDYTLTATLETGGVFSKQSLNGPAGSST